jgi:hypothetical protein
MLVLSRNPTQHQFPALPQRLLSAQVWATLDTFAYKVSAVTAFAQPPRALRVKD